jgi:mRNA-degrading endonuclease RelE of RelBE toxin-antitoxin system
MKIRYRETPTFKKSWKKLVKRYATLPSDLETVKEGAIELLHIHGIDNQSVCKIQGVSSESFDCYVVKKFACRSLKGRGARSGIRLTYVFDPVKKIVYFVEIYYKSDQAVEDKKLLKEMLLILEKEE